MRCPECNTSVIEVVLDVGRVVLVETEASDPVIQVDTLVDGRLLGRAIHEIRCDGAPFFGRHSGLYARHLCRAKVAAASRPEFISVGAVEHPTDPNCTIKSGSDS